MKREIKEKVEKLHFFLYANWYSLIVIQAIWPYSGHYCPTEKNFMEFIGFLMEHNVDMTNVKVNE